MRRTKAEAEQTRRTLMTTALRLFAEKGVARTSLEQIALAAGLTRGAVYWHFSNKAALFSALREQTLLPLFQRMSVRLADAQPGDPLLCLEESMLDILRQLEDDPTTRETFALVSLKCEYVGEFQPVLAQVLSKSEEWVAQIRAIYRQAVAKHPLPLTLNPDLLALETQAFLFGLIRLWLMDDAAGLRPQAPAMIRCHIATRRALFPG